MTTSQIVVWGPRELTEHLDDVIHVYGQAMGYSPDLLLTRRNYMGSHVTRRDFHAVASLDEHGRVLGFGYGYHSEPGQWWHDQVRGAMRREARGFWLANCFEVNYGAQVREGVAILNVGAAVTNFVVVDHGETIFCRDIPIGGQSFTNDIHKELGVSQEEAETLKLSATMGHAVPQDVGRIITSSNEVIAEEAVRERLTKAGVVVRGSTAEAFGEHMRAEFVRWNKVREAAGIPQQ